MKLSRDSQAMEFSPIRKFNPIATEVQEYYASMPKEYPDFNGGWQPHIVFVGEIIEVRCER